jgi:N-methylhydantoinase B
VKIVAPKGCIANPVFPAPTIARFAPGNVVADTLMKALAPAVPDKVSAGVANLKAIAFSGSVDENQWVHIEIFEGSYGGRQGKDGMDSVDTLYANTRNNPIEDIESHVPLRVTRYELRDDVISAGQWRGGLNSIKEVEMLVDSTISVEGDGHSHSPWGYADGTDGYPSSLTLVASNGESSALPSMLPPRPAKAGDRVVAVGGVGGGYGNPLERDPEAVRDDFLDEHITTETARQVFGVALADDGSIDEAETRKLRA